MNKRWAIACAIAVCAGLLLTAMLPMASASAGGSGSNGNDNSQYVIVEFRLSATGDYTGGLAGYPATEPTHGHKLDTSSAAVTKYRGLLGVEHANFKAWLHSNAPAMQVVDNYDLALNGVAVALNGQSWNSLSNGPDVIAVTPDTIYYPSMDVSVPLVDAPQVWSMLGADPFGSGTLPDYGNIKVGIIDSGIDDTHPFIASCRAPGSIQHDVFFSGAGLFDASRLLDNTHGTHVAGTIGGCPTKGTIPLANGYPFTLAAPMSGIAPGVTLHDYNVFPGFGAAFIHHLGGAFSHDIIAAVEKAVADGMDVINLSLGGTVQGPHDTLAEAINVAVDAGTIAVIAAGNAGPGILTVESPGNAANAITAAASSDPHYAGIPVDFGGHHITALEGDFAGFDPAVTAITSATTPADGCTAIAESLTGMIAVIDRGVCTFGTKISNAQAKGAVGVLIVNNAVGDPIVMGGDGIHFPTIPAAMVSLTDGAVLKGDLGVSTTVDGTHFEDVVTSNADILASFSSRGPTPYDFLLKPDVTAPGVNVLSSVWIRQSDGSLAHKFDFFQGTSMATPHITGAVVLLLAVHPGWSPAEVKSALVDNADRTVTSTGGLGPIARGGGRLNIERAANAGVTISPASVSFGAFTGQAPLMSSVTLSFMEETGSAQTCSVSVTGIPTGATIGLSTSSISLAADGTASLTVTLNGGRSLATGAYWGDVVVTCGSATYLAPWWAGVQRSNGALNGNQNSPAAVFGLDPSVYANTSDMSGVTWTQ